MSQTTIPIMCLEITIQITREPIKTVLLRLNDENGDCRAMVPILPADIKHVITNLRQAHKLLLRGDA